jgi:hypothetical protein
MGQRDGTRPSSIGLAKKVAVLDVRGRVREVHLEGLSGEELRELIRAAARLLVDRRTRVT